MTVQELSQHEEQLSDEDKLRLADALVEQVVGPSPAWEAAWLVEVRERRTNFLAGKLEASPYRPS